MTPVDSLDVRPAFSDDFHPPERQMPLAPPTWFAEVRQTLAHIWAEEGRLFGAEPT
jgi:hypothetical protein